MAQIGWVVLIFLKLTTYVVYSWLVGEFDRFHLWLLAGTVALLALAVGLAVSGIDIAVCLLVLMLAPVVTIAGYETIGHADQADVIQRLVGSAAR